MNLHAEEQSAIKEYLLGLLPPERRQPLEERLLTDAAFYEELRIAEDELTDQYLAGQLTEAERQHFETHFLLTPERRQKARFARTLRRYVGDTASTAREEAAAEPSEDDRGVTKPDSGGHHFFSFLRAPRPRLAFALAAAVLLCVSAAVWVAVRDGRAPTDPGGRGVLAVTLTPGVVREGGETQRVVIPPGTGTVRLRLELAADEYPAYRAELQTDERRTVRTDDDLKSQNIEGRRVVDVHIPAGLLSAGDFQLRLTGVGGAGGVDEPVGRYVFKVLAR